MEYRVSYGDNFAYLAWQLPLDSENLRGLVAFEGPKIQKILQSGEGQGLKKFKRSERLRDSVSQKYVEQLVLRLLRAADCTLQETGCDSFIRVQIWVQLAFRVRRY